VVAGARGLWLGTVPATIAADGDCANWESGLWRLYALCDNWESRIVSACMLDMRMCGLASSVKKRIYNQHLHDDHDLRPNGPRTRPNTKRFSGRKKCIGRRHVRIRTWTSGSGRPRPIGRQNTSAGRHPDVKPNLASCAFLLPIRPQMNFGTGHTVCV